MGLVYGSGFVAVDAADDQRPLRVPTQIRDETLSDARYEDVPIARACPRLGHTRPAGRRAALLDALVPREPQPDTWLSSLIGFRRVTADFFGAHDCGLHAVTRGAVVVSCGRNNDRIRQRVKLVLVGLRGMPAP